MIGLWLPLVGCAPAPCHEGFEERDDGVCARETILPFEGEADVQVLLDALPACVSGDPGDGLDFARRCADGACAGMTAAEISDALGETPRCTPYLEPQYQETYVDCTWPRGLSETFEDFDADSIPDEGDTSYSLGVAEPYVGASADGLGLDAGLRCFVDLWGAPSSVTLAPDGEGWALAWLGWRFAGVGHDPADGPSDGTPSEISLYAL